MVKRNDGEVVVRLQRVYACKNGGLGVFHGVARHAAAAVQHKHYRPSEDLQARQQGINKPLATKLGYYTMWHYYDTMYVHQ